MVMPDPRRRLPEVVQFRGAPAIVWNEAGNDKRVARGHRLQGHIDLQAAAMPVPDRPAGGTRRYVIARDFAALAISDRTLGERKDIDQSDKAGPKASLRSDDRNSHPEVCFLASSARSMANSPPSNQGVSVADFASRERISSPHSRSRRSMIGT